MKILFSNVAPIIIYGLGPAFSDLGHQVQYVFVDAGESLEKAIDEFSPDIVFNEGGINRMGKLFPLLEDKQIPHVYWAIEDPAWFDLLSLPYALKSALVFTPCQESIEHYQRNGINALLMMFACHPAFHRIVPPKDQYRHDLVFVGNNYDDYPSRQQGTEIILNPLLSGDFDIKVYGNEWWIDHSRRICLSPAHYGGYLPNEDLPAVCSSAKIILGMHSVNTSRTMMSMRTFEILGSAGFYLTQWTEAIENLFQNHKHLVWSRSAQETLDLVNYYLQHPELRIKIARQGQEEVYANHTYHKRIHDLQAPLEQISNLGKQIRLSPVKIRIRKAVHF